FGGTLGVGGRLGFTLPLFPLDILATAETFFPDQDDASLRGASLDVALDLLPLPVLTPYATGGLTFRQVDLGFGEGSESRSGLNLGAGLKLALAGFGVFGEARYEFVNAPERQGIVRVGVMFGG